MTDERVTTDSGVGQLPEVELGQADGHLDPGAAHGRSPASDVDLDRVASTLEGDPALEREGVEFSPTALVVQLTGQFVLGGSPAKAGGAPLTAEERARGFAEFCGGLLQALDFDGAVKHYLERSGLGREVKPGIVLALGVGVVAVGAMLYRERKPKAPQPTPRPAAQEMNRKAAA